jgi:hypothetical protein
MAGVTSEHQVSAGCAGLASGSVLFPLRVWEPGHTTYGPHMGGLGRGGLRPGSGAKPRRPAWFPTVEPFEPSQVLTEVERDAWDRQAPHAFRRRTQTGATEYACVLLCRNVVLERTLALDPDQRGGRNHRGVMQRIDAQLLRFDLARNGKPHGELWDLAPEPPSPLALLRSKRAAVHAPRIT